MLSLVDSIENQQVILNNIKHILTSRILTLPTTASRNNVTIIDHLNTNYFLSVMGSGIVTADILDYVPIFPVSKDLMLDSSHKSIHITKREINNKL